MPEGFSRVVSTGQEGRVIVDLPVKARRIQEGRFKYQDSYFNGQEVEGGSI